ncbi:MAG: biotin--[acetyl-CoA-carboxylase] ligase [Alcanivorax sp.]|nr:biotin--[acetyl-CoA-carboxylase] ligase [Alcanivorax sp.]
MGGVSGVSEADLQLIRHLADGAFCSGSQLGELLGVSRAAVWKRMQRLTELGLAVESVKGRGYRLAHPLRLLDPGSLSAALAGRADLHYHCATGSTNADALALEGGGKPQLVVAEYQYAGRGRRGRQWQSPFAANLYLSLRYSLARGFSALGGLSLAVGVAAAQVLMRHVPGLPVGLKWPNDLQVNGDKLGGILIELAGEMDGQVDVVVGLGINGEMTPDQARDIDQRWTDLASHAGRPLDRSALCADLAVTMLEALEQFSADGFAPFMAGFERLDVCNGLQVEVLAGDQRICGVASGVSDDGALLLRTEQGLSQLHGGEVSLRVQ